jgi:hypothetical protein
MPWPNCRRCFSEILESSSRDRVGATTCLVLPPGTCQEPHDARKRRLDPCSPSPHHKHRLGAYHWSPVLQALIISTAWALITGLLVSLLIYWRSWPWWLIPLATIAVGTTIFALNVTGNIRERQQLLWKREEAEKRDPDHATQKPQQETLQIELLTRHPDKRIKQIQRIDFDVDPDRIIALAKGLLAGRPFSEAEWTGRGRLFSKSEFRALRTQLLDRNLLAWRNSAAPAQGVELTHEGRTLFEQLAHVQTE